MKLTTTKFTIANYLNLQKEILPGLRINSNELEAFRKGNLKIKNHIREIKKAFGNKKLPPMTLYCSI